MNIPVPGLTVLFQVKSGGGTVTGGSAVTGADGVAKVGDWILGTGEGSNQLTASLAAGSLPPVTFTAIASYSVSLLTSGVIGAAGGTLVYHHAGDPLDGLTLSIPPGAFAGPGTWTISSKPKGSAPGNPNLHQTGPVILISTDQGMADSLLTLTIPVQLPADSIATALLYDPATQKYEGLPTVSGTATSITVATRHFSAGLMAGLPVASSLRGRGALISGALNLEVLMTSQAFNAQEAFAAYGAGGVSTQFEPTRDAWEFGNYGSYITPNGHTAGTALSALDYFLRRKGGSGPDLFGRYARWAFWAGDSKGYRLAAMTETDVNWPQANAAMQQLDARAIAQQFNPDLAHYFNLLATMAATHQPQLIFAGAQPGLRGYVALVAYKVTPTEIWAADPNNPGQTIKIPFTGSGFGSTPITSITGGSSYNTNLFRFAGISALINWSQLGQRWSEFDANTIGTGVFPNYSLEYFDEDFQLWKPFPQNDQLSIDWTDIKLRAHCPGCEAQLGSNPSDLAALDVYSRSGAQLTSDRSSGSVTFRIPNNENSVGVHILGGRQCTGCQPFWGHVDFRILTINSSHYYITPDPVAGTSADILTLTTKNLSAGSPPSLRYDWDFGDGQTAQKTNDSTVTHRWTQAGVYTASVIVTDISTGTAVGRTNVRVTIDLAVPIWRFTSVNMQYFGGPLSDFSGQIQVWFQQDGNVFSGLHGRPDLGMLFYFSQPFTAGGKSFRAGLYLQGNNGSNNFDANLPAIPLAQTPLGTYPDAFFDDLILDQLSQQGNLGSGTIDGHGVTRTRDMSGWPSGFGVHTVTHWEVHATKVGTTMSGTFTYYVEQWGEQGCQQIMNGDGSISIVGCVGGFGGTSGYQFSFSATRLR